MTKSKHSEAQIIAALKQMRRDAGRRMWPAICERIIRRSASRSAGLA